MNRPAVAFSMYRNTIGKYIATAASAGSRRIWPVASAAIAFARDCWHQFRSIRAPFIETPPASTIIVDPLLDKVIAEPLTVIEDPPILTR